MLECMLSKYQERREMRRILENLAEMMREAADGISAIDEEIAEASAGSAESYRRIREAAAVHALGPQHDRPGVCPAHPGGNVSNYFYQNCNTN